MCRTAVRFGWLCLVVAIRALFLFFKYAAICRAFAAVILQNDGVEELKTACLYESGECETAATVRVACWRCDSNELW